MIPSTIEMVEAKSGRSGEVWQDSHGKTLSEAQRTTRSTSTVSLMRD
jgi:hypothetical protein